MTPIAEPTFRCPICRDTGYTTRTGNYTDDPAFNHRHGEIAAKYTAEYAAPCPGIVGAGCRFLIWLRSRSNFPP